MTQHLYRSPLFILLILIIIPGCGPQLSQEELTELWRPAIGMSALAYGTCEGLQQTAGEVASGELDGFEALGAVMATGIMIQAVDEGLANWESEPTGTAAQKVEVTNHIDQMRTLVGQWMDDQIDSVQIAAELPELCGNLNDTFEDIVRTSRRAGLEDETAEQILLDIEEALSSADLNQSE
jgi:hypothetical protein